MEEVIDIFGPSRTVRNRGVGGTDGHKEKKGLYHIINLFLESEIST